jgi:cytidylate kinase
MTRSSNVVVAIDGPAASGKSSVARRLADRLDFAYVNSGALYRAIAWLANAAGVSANDREAILGLIAVSRFEFRLQDKQSVVLIDGFNPAPHLQDEVVNQTVSTVSTITEVRSFIVEHLRAFADLDNLIVEGRDIGSVVFPKTPYKFYIDASPEVREQRRSAQGLLDEISKRDRLDTSRATAPLRIPEDATVVDSSSLTIDAVVVRIVERLKDQNLPQAASL